MGNGLSKLLCGGSADLIPGVLKIFLFRVSSPGLSVLELASHPLSWSLPWSSPWGQAGYRTKVFAFRKLGETYRSLDASSSGFICKIIRIDFLIPKRTKPTGCKHLIISFAELPEVSKQSREFNPLKAFRIICQMSLTVRDSNRVLKNKNQAVWQGARRSDKRSIFKHM
jgi:hypothetical protein